MTSAVVDEWPVAGKMAREEGGSDTAGVEGSWGVRPSECPTP